LEEDGSFELAKLAAGLQAEVFGQPGTSSLERCQRVRLASAAVEGNHELGVEPLSVGVESDGAFELRNDLAVLAEDEPCLCQALERGQAVALQPAPRHRRERRILDVSESRPAPQRQGGGKKPRGG
jgi:hypothetical protein